MKKIACFLLVMVMTVMSFAGCGVKEGAGKEGTGKEETGKKEYHVALLVPIRGDQSFYDLAVNGMKLVDEQVDGATTKVIEIGTDESKWESYFLDAAEGNYDLIISGTWQQTPYLEKMAKQFPNKKFINFDVDKKSGLNNVYSMFYSTNELGFLAGVTAASVTTSTMKNANADAKIGFIGGMDIPGINDFLVGYIEGALYVNKNIKVLTAYSNDFNDVAKAKELAINQYKNGADIIFSAAGNAGNGAIEAAKELKKYVIGVDSDQALLYKDTDEEKANTIVTSGIKTIDKAILNAVKQAKEGTLKFGEHVKYGYATGGVGLAKNDIFEKLVTDDAKNTISKAESKLKAGDVKVSSAFDMDVNQINKLKESVKP